MEKLICQECGKVFEYKKMSSCKAQLSQHIQREHNMSLVDYIVKYFYNGIRPKCPCGCGHELNLHEGGERWKFNKYYADTCYGRLVRAKNNEIEGQILHNTKKDFDIVKYYEAHYDRETYQKAFDMLNTKKYSLTDVSKAYQIDKRTLKKVWLALNIVTNDELTNLLEYTKYNLSAINYPSNFSENEEILSWMYKMITKFPNKYTIHSLIKEYNSVHRDNPCRSFDTTVAKSLYKVYGNEIDIYLSVGYHSSEEYSFYQILSFYIPEYKTKMGKRFILKNGNYVYYDFLIGSRLLIEYDSVGKFHQEENYEHYLEKENFAIENGYDFLRLTKSDIENIETIKNIRKKLNL